MSGGAPLERGPLESAPNLRDLGGIPTAAGPVRPGVLFRSASLASLTAADGARLAALGVARVYDLRTAAEASGAPDRLPAGLSLVPLDILADSSLSVAANLTDVAGDPGALAARLAGGDAERLFEETYRDLVRLPSAQRGYRALLLGLVDRAPAGATLFHCTTGKDRTGWAAALVLALLGAPEDRIYEDYLRTNTDLLPALEPVFARAEAQGVARAALLPVLGVQRNYLDAAFAQVTEQFGSVERYATEGLGLLPVQLSDLRERLT